MKEKSIASRYAKALFDIAEDKDSLDAFFEQWSFITDAIKQNEEVRILFESRLLPKENKKDLAKKLFSATVDPLILEFLFFLFDKSRENYIIDIWEVLHEMMDVKNGILTVNITSAFPLAKNQEEDLVSAIGTATGKTIRLDLSVDPKLIGGLVMTINDTVYDGSLTGQLSLLKQQLAAGSDK